MSCRLGGSGLATALGASLCETRQALAEGRRAFYRHGGFIGSDYKRQLTAFAERQRLSGFTARAKSLLAAALTDFFGNCGVSQAYRVALCLPDHGPSTGLDAAQLHETARQLAEQLGASLSAAGWPAPLEMLVSAEGVSTPATAMAFAMEQAEDTLLVSVDSYADLDRLEALSRAGVLFSDTNQWGFVPGEGAAVILLQPTTTTGLPGAPHVAAVAVAQEPVGEADPGDSAFEGMSRAIHEALRRLPEGSALAALQSNWCNSRYRAAELSYAMRRTPISVLPTAVSPEHLSLSLGDTGAAYLPIALVIGSDWPALTVASSRSDTARAAVLTL